MQIGISSYSLSQAIRSGEKTIINVMEWAAEQGCEHIEIVPIGFSLDNNPDLVKEIRMKAEQLGIILSSYLIKANFVQDDESQYKAEIDRVKQQVDIAAALGVARMRHDVAFRPVEETTLSQFYVDLPRLTEACRVIADYAKQYGIITSVENHGIYIQHSERIQALIQAVDRANFKVTLDIGNCLCVDEDPIAALKRSLPYAAMVHLKDFYYRPYDRNPGEGWFQTTNGNYLRGSIFGHGDIDVWEVLRIIKSSDYDGYLSLEFEGKEACEFGTRVGLDNIRKILEQV